MLASLVLAIAMVAANEPDPMDELIKDAGPRAPRVESKTPAAPTSAAVDNEDADDTDTGEVSDSIWRNFNAPDRSHGNRVGAGLGVAAYSGAFWLVEPLLEVKSKYFDLALGAPLRLGFAPRAQDWDEWRDYLKILRDLRVGTDAWSVHLTRFRDLTLGYGGLARHYNPNLFLNTPHVGAQVRVSSDFLSGEAALADVGLQSAVLLARLATTPFAHAHPIQLSSLKLGVNFVADFGAPAALTTDDAGVTRTDASGIPLWQAQALAALAVDLGLTVMQAGAFALEVYGEYNQLFAAGNGIHAGTIATVRAGSLMFKARAEYRSLGAQYLASYVDAFYDVQRFQFDPATNLPKQAYLRSALPTGRGHGGYFELGLSLGSYWALAAALEASTRGVPEQALTLHTTITPADWLEFSATYQTRALSSLTAAFAGDRSTMIGAGLRVTAADWIAFSGTVTRLFAWQSVGFDGIFTASLSAELTYAW